MHPLEALKINPFILAPMAGITDHAFRHLMRKLGSSVVVTELVSANGIEYTSERTFKLMSFDESQRPIGIQLFGEDPEVLGRAAQVVQEKGADFVDLNFGCPVPKVVKKGAGSAMLKDPVQFEKVLTAVKKAVEIPVTIKIRTGWDANTRNAVEICKIAENCGMTWVAIHGRTRAQGYSGFADWDFITDVKSKVNIPLIGNGDIHTSEQAVQRLRNSGCDGVMIGRGSLKNPLIFKEALKLFQESSAYPVQTKWDPSVEAISSYGDIIRELHLCLEKYAEPHIIPLQLKKFAAWFSSGFPGASQFRKNIFQTQEKEAILSESLNFFEKLSWQNQADTSQEGFLMGGHG